jgi:hypothetical protein
MEKKRFYAILFAFLFFSLACSLLRSKSNKDAAVVVEDNVPLVPTATQMAPTAVPPTKAPPTEVPPTVEPPTPEPPAAPAWRMAPPEGSYLVVQDVDKDPEWEDLAATHASNLAIPAPYYYELYVLRDGIKYPEVRDHYTAEMSSRRYDKARDEQGANQMYLMTFLYKLDKNSKNAVLFYAELPNRSPMVLVIYSKPIE